MPMPKTITSNQLLGEIGKAAVRLRFLNKGFQFGGRLRLEAGVDGIAEVMDKGKPLARMIAVQVKARESANYSAEDETRFAQIASEVLSLTKIDWNSTQMNQKLPIPIRAARAVGEVLKYVTDQKISLDDARYI
jgi:hypothetical protein